jgi:hypothetical protein
LFDIRLKGLRELEVGSLKVTVKSERNKETFRVLIVK